MPQTPHIEQHFRSSASIRDIVIGMSDGLTVPFAIAAGLSGVLDATHIVVTAGLAEIAAGSLSMGLGGYLAAKSDADHYRAERRREEREIIELPEAEVNEVATILAGYGLDEARAREVAEAFKERPKEWVDFMMRYELDLAEPDPKRIVVSPLTIGGAYAAGGIIPLFPYFLVNSVHAALPYSIVATVVALFAFGWFKGHYTGARPLTSALQTVLVGGLAALAAFSLAKLII
ncbi:MAG: VIT1/CCC1 transporter family protein [Thermoplasmata archaeon]|nr:VIT1/CCC1 transporter family protein [Thermoplasmata archaeon]MCI4353788.1 VIT1/CCC1 transporter family protein [Thermoplasmata archaeon]